MGLHPRRVATSARLNIKRDFRFLKYSCDVLFFRGLDFLTAVTADNGFSDMAKEFSRRLSDPFYRLNDRFFRLAEAFWRPTEAFWRPTD
jgi:hypothetical protein